MRLGVKRLAPGRPMEGSVEGDLIVITTVLMEKLRIVCADVKELLDMIAAQ